MLNVVLMLLAFPVLCAVWMIIQLVDCLGGLVLAVFAILRSFVVYPEKKPQADREDWKDQTGENVVDFALWKARKRAQQNNTHRAR